MDWGRLWAARGCLGTIFKKVQKITSELQKSDRPTACFFFGRSLPLAGWGWGLAAGRWPLAAGRRRWRGGRGGRGPGAADRGAGP